MREQSRRFKPYEEPLQDFEPLGAFGIGLVFAAERHPQAIFRLSNSTATVVTTHRVSGGMGVFVFVL